MQRSHVADARLYMSSASILLIQSWASNVARIEMGAAASNQQPLQTAAAAGMVDQERGYYGQPVDATTGPPPTSSYGVFMNTVTAFVPEEHVNRLVVYMAVFGALFTVIGVIGLIFPFVFALAMEQVIGTLLVLGGVFSIVQYVIVYDMPGTSSFFLLGLLHLGIGLWMLMQPIEAGIMLIYVLSGWLLGHGLLKSLMACQVRNMRSWPLVFVSGMLSVVLAFFILVLAPRLGVVLLGLIFGSDILVSGLSMMSIAAMTYFAKKKPPAREPLLTPPPPAAAASA